MKSLKPHERLVLESCWNHYQYHIVGPGRVWIKPWQQIVTQLNVGPQSQEWTFEQVRTAENVPLTLTIKVLYQIDPTLFKSDLLPKLAGLNEGGWLSILQWRLQHIIGQLLTNYSWRDLTIAQTRLENQLTKTLDDTVKFVGLKVMAVHLLKISLPQKLQQAILQAEHDGIEPKGRAMVLKEYAEIFGSQLGEVMPQVFQWELLNALHKSGASPVVLAQISTDQAAKTNDDQPSGNDKSWFQLPLADLRD